MSTAAEPTDRRGQSTVVGAVLLIGMILVGTGGVVLLGGEAVSTMRSDVDVRQAELTMSQFDRQAGLVAGGAASSRTVDLEGLGGTTEVRPDAGWLRVTHANHSGGHDEVLYNRTLGAAVYRNGPTSVAYQGGGVFLSRDGGASVISPPELHYQRATLTLPVVRVRGDAGAIGGSALVLTPAASDVPVYPGTGTYDATDEPYENPVSGGQVRVTVQSDYYLAWAEYFRTGTDGEVRAVDHDRETVTLELTANGMYGPFEMPRAGDDIRLRGLNDTHSMDRFEFTLEPDEDAANFANLNWSLRESTPERSVEVRFVSDGGKPCKDGEIDALITYEGPDGATHRWRATDAFVENATGGGFSYRCTDGPTLSVNLTGTEQFTYESGPDTVAFEHAEHGEPESFAHGDRTSVDQLVNHYIALFGSSVDLTVVDQGMGETKSASGSVEEADSGGTLEYGQSDVVTYLHITDSAVEATDE